jgi:rhodanese-related sulfurtransferase
MNRCAINPSLRGFPRDDSPIKRLTSPARKRLRALLGLGRVSWIFPALALCGLLPNLAVGQDLEAVKKKVREQFPSVRQISTSELATRLKQTNQPAPVLLDARTPAEFAVSHLPGARQVDSKPLPTDLVNRLGTNRLVVVYCSVGYRSSRLIEQLQKAGCTNVFNLEGSIFQWANEDRPLERDGQPVKEVHPYNKANSRLLRPEYRGKATSVRE